ncbi:FAD-dependent oxidoreductase [uncultured Cedecea sp.]|uniref:NAD(P)/FAD-dependent oxidoreductase n=1 Tax=uncultured Cedecea sp. TaxID=988762 RepID=UPI0026234021|nr:FAD-dependent oxidoreductase [uncultured Cedecea sp.]
MNKRIVVAGSGFAGLWAAISAKRAIVLADQENEIEVLMVSPAPNVVIRPRLYEQSLDNMDPDILPLLNAVGVKHIAGLVESINDKTQTVIVKKISGEQEIIEYDRFVLATGSTVFTPDVPGLAEYAFSVSDLNDAKKLEQHLKNLHGQPNTAARNTVVVAGGGLTGLETATEMPARLRNILGEDQTVRVVIIDTAPDIGAGMGSEAALIIQNALTELGIEGKANAKVTAVNGSGVTLSTGEEIAANTVIWTAGMRASRLTAQLSGEKDHLGRVLGDAFLHAPGAKNIFVTGDTVKVPTDEIGNFNVMSCQHAMSLGRVAGHNAAAELVDLPLHPYSQPKYVTCLDLGAWGALYAEGWDRQVRVIGEEAKKIKQEINTIWIYPPAADREAAFAIANPDFVIVP